VDNHAKRPSQRTIIETINDSKKRIQDDKSVRKCIMRVMAATGVSFRFWSHPTVRDLMDCLLKKVPCKHLLVDQVCLSRETIRNYSSEESLAIREELKVILPMMAKTGRLSITLDHKHVRSKTTSNWKILGIECAIKCEDSFWYCLLDYIPMSDSTTANTVDKVKKVLADYNLTEVVEKQMVCFVSDQAAEPISRAFTSNVTVCGSHNVSNTLKRSCEENLQPSVEKKYKSLVSFIDRSETVTGGGFSPEVSYRTLNSFFTSQILSNRDNIENFYKSKKQGMVHQSQITYTI